MPSDHLMASPRQIEIREACNKRAASETAPGRFPPQVSHNAHTEIGGRP
jgi:hypothetical protein